MCLRTTQKKPIFLKEDIIVYKGIFLSRVLSSDNILFSDTPKNNPVSLVFFYYHKIDDKSSLIINHGIVKEGFHSYIEPELVKQWCYDIILQCRIPKGSKIIKGINRDIASNRIIFERIVSSKTSIKFEQINWRK